MEKELKTPERARCALEILADTAADGRYVPIADIWEEALTRVPLTPYESEINTKNRPRGETNWRFASSDFVSAGWLQKNPSLAGEWAITPSGIAALPEYPGDELHQEAQRLSAMARDRRRNEIERALPDRWVSDDNNQRRLLAAAEVIVDEGLRKGLSAFAPGREVWTARNIRELHSLWVAAAKEDGKGFNANLEQQLADATDDQKLLMAEVLAFQLLPIAKVMGHAKKRERIESALNAMRHPVEIPRVFDTAFAGGAFNPGVGMQSHINHAITVILEVLLAWAELSDEEQHSALEDPRRWRDLVLGKDSGFPTQRYALLYLVHPGFFGPIVSIDHCKQIRAAFIGEIGGEFSDDPDADLQKIVIALQVKEGKPVDLYDPAHESRWKGAKPPIHNLSSRRRTSNLRSSIPVVSSPPTSTSPNSPRLHICTRRGSGRSQAPFTVAARSSSTARPEPARPMWRVHSQIGSASQAA